MGQESGPIGQEFISLAKLIIDYQEKLKLLDKDNPLLKSNIDLNGGELGYLPGFGERYDGMPINQALEQHHGVLEREINKIKGVGFPQ